MRRILLSALLTCLAIPVANATSLHRGHVLEFIPEAVAQLERADRRYAQMVRLYDCPYPALPWERCYNARKPLRGIGTELERIRNKLDALRWHVSFGDLDKARRLATQPFWEGRSISRATQAINYWSAKLAGEQAGEDFRWFALDLVKANGRLWGNLDRMIWHINDAREFGE